LYGVMSQKTRLFIFVLRISNLGKSTLLKETTVLGGSGELVKKRRNCWPHFDTLNYGVVILYCFADC